MSVDSVLDQAFTVLLAKARQRSLDDTPVASVQSTALEINFDGVGFPLTVGSAGMLEVTFPCTILACHLFAGVWNITSGFQPVAVTATVELRLGSQGSWTGGTLPLTGPARPALSGSPESDFSIADWAVTELQPGDLILYALSSFVGIATFILLSLPVRRLDTRDLGVSDLTDGTGDDFTDASGDSFTVRG